MQTSRDDVIRQVTLRLPERLLKSARRVAKRRNQSLNAFVRALLERMDEQERHVLLRAAYDSLAADVGEADVEAFLPAQAEVARRG